MDTELLKFYTAMAIYGGGKLAPPLTVLAPTIEAASRHFSAAITDGRVVKVEEINKKNGLEFYRVEEKEGEVRSHGEVEWTPG
jgi:hypothetical protein